MYHQKSGNPGCLSLEFPPSSNLGRSRLIDGAAVVVFVLALGDPTQGPRVAVYEKQEQSCETAEGHSQLHPWPPGLNIHPVIHPQGWTLTTTYLEEWRGKQINSPQGITSPPEDNFTLRGQISPLGTTSPLGSKFAPRGEAKNGPQHSLKSSEINRHNESLSMNISSTPGATYLPTRKETVSRKEKVTPRPTDMPALSWCTKF
jgi:hypothetical protein